MYSERKKYLISILKILLDIDDIEVMRYTIESLIDELEDVDSDTSEEPNTETMTNFGGDYEETFKRRN